MGWVSILVCTRSFFQGTLSRAFVFQRQLYLTTNLWKASAADAACSQYIEGVCMGEGEKKNEDGYVFGKT